MGNYQKFRERFDSAKTDEERKLIILDHVPVIEDKPKETFEFVYGVDSDPWHYEREWYHQLWSAVYKELAPIITPETTILDLGCGKGHLWRHQDKYLTVKPKQITGIDISETAIREGTKWFEDNKIDNMNLFCADLCEEGLNIRGTQDIILTISALYYIPAIKRYKLFEKIVDSGSKYIFTIATKWKGDKLYDFPSSYRPNLWHLKSEFSIRFKEPEPVQRAFYYLGYLYERK